MVYSGIVSLRVSSSPLLSSSSTSIFGLHRYCVCVRALLPSTARPRIQLTRQILRSAATRLVFHLECDIWFIADHMAFTLRISRRSINPALHLRISDSAPQRQPAMRPVAHHPRAAECGTDRLADSCSALHKDLKRRRPNHLQTATHSSPASSVVAFI
ncbi:hypothetical protein EJ06DRAFT_256263 [Trichodelitschia bisporula]|uniref:Uncharacterized protein n=1 Tax=Trichodelitschia bisporula TaxID=703511 RepID=A0A6G1HJ26_9PEZI|nr:hypothetical protein EJ06DRAFT_256263 [Trichodelitschia bisporula]